MIKRKKKVISSSRKLVDINSFTCVVYLKKHSDTIYYLEGKPVGKLEGGAIGK